MKEEVTEFTHLVDLPTWGVRRGHGSFLTLDFGEKSTRSPEFGRFHLWLYGARWSLFRGDSMLCENSSDVCDIDREVHVINGNRVLCAIVNSRKGMIVFESDLKLLFKTGMNMDQWIFFTEHGSFTCDKNADVKYEPYA